MTNSLVLANFGFVSFGVMLPADLAAEGVTAREDRTTQWVKLPGRDPICLIYTDWYGFWETHVVPKPGEEALQWRQRPLPEGLDWQPLIAYPSSYEDGFCPSVYVLMDDGR